jgi:hypothetical protein
MRWHRAARKDYYARVGRARGEKAAKELAAAVSEQWKKTARRSRDNQQKGALANGDIS